MGGRRRQRSGQTGPLIYVAAAVRLAKRTRLHPAMVRFHPQLVAGNPAVAQLTATTHRLDPAEDLCNSFPRSLAHSIALMAGGTPVDCRALAPSPPPRSGAKTPWPRRRPTAAACSWRTPSGRRCGRSMFRYRNHWNSGSYVSRSQICRSPRAENKVISRQAFSRCSGAIGARPLSASIRSNVGDNWPGHDPSRA